MPRLCSSCHRRSPDGVANIYWAYYPSSDNRVSYRGSYCPDCINDHVTPILTNSTDNSEVDVGTQCAICGIDAQDDTQWLYGTAYIPGRESIGLESVLCSSCFATMQAWVITSGKRLPDRASPARREGVTSPVWALLAG